MIAIIAGMTPSRVIGKGNSLPWKIKADMDNFVRLTLGNTIIMGKNTYDSIGKPLPKRHNIVLSKEKIEIDGADVCASIPEALHKARAYGKDVFIAGGANVYAQTIDLADVMYLSYIKKEYEGDIYFPEFDVNNWRVVDEKEYDEFTFVTYKKNDQQRQGRI